jgi:hypothetical protein
MNGPDEPADLVTAIVRPYVMTPEEWQQAFLTPPGGTTGLLLRLLTGLRELEPPEPDARLGDRSPEHRVLGERLREVNQRSSSATGPN